jgi:hypothetical protein
MTGARLPSPSAQPRACGRGALYLGHKGEVRVHVDGPALTVRGEHHALARYPFERIARIVAQAGRVELSAEALAACCRWGIAVVVIEDGEVSGYLWPAQAQDTRTAERIDNLLDRPDWPRLYENWKRNERMRIVRHWCARLRENGNEIDAAFIEEIKRAYVQAVESPARDLRDDGLVVGAVHALTIERLRAKGFAARYWDGDGQTLELAQDIAATLLLRLRLELHGIADRARIDMPLWLRLFHLHAHTLAGLADLLADHLSKRLANIIETWET